MSEKYSLNKRQIIKGLILAIATALIPLLTKTFSVETFDIRTVFTIDLLNNIIATSVPAGIGYLIYTFFEGKKEITNLNEGTPLN